jgi:hypothetical protein
MDSNDSDNDDETEYDDDDCMDVSNSHQKATEGDTPDDVVVVNQGYSIFDDDMIDKYTNIKQMRVFKSWEEEWEINVVYNKSPVGEAKLLDKYGGLSWYDWDNKQMVHSDKNDLKWIKITRRKKGG